MPNKTRVNPFLKMNHVDLAFAMHRLVRLGKTNALEVRNLAGERRAVIAELQAQVSALKAAVDPGAAQLPAREQVVERKTTRRKARRPGRPRTAMRAKPAKIAKRERRAKQSTPSIVAARKLQGRYMGIRRHLKKRLQMKATKIAQTRGVAAALKFVEAHQVKHMKPAVQMSAAARAARKIQGRYLGMRRLLSRELQDEATKIAQASGVAAALRFAEANRPAAQA